MGQTAIANGPRDAATRDQPHAPEAHRRLLAGLPVDVRRLDVDGVPTFLFDGGSGPSVVLLHGGVETGGVYWAPDIARLAQGHRVILPDVPGLGESGPMDRPDTEALCRWLAELIRLTCLDEPTLVAHSLLGSIAARFAVDHELQLRRIADADLRRIRIPTAMVWGRHDRMVPLGLAERAHACFGWPLDVIDDSGHVPFLERPDEFLEALQRVIDRPDRRTS